MKINNMNWLTWVIPLVLMSCGTTPPTMFEKAVNDAAVVEPADVYDRLVAVTPDNDALVWNADKTCVRVVMWKSRKSYESFYKDKHATDADEAYLTWVTTVPEVKTFAQRYLSQFPLATKDKIDLRLKQYLGLKPEWQYDLFIEMWVSPKDLFRPCTDPELDDTVCNIGFSKKIPKVKLDDPVFEIRQCHIVENVKAGQVHGIIPTIPANISPIGWPASNEQNKISFT